MSHAIEQLAYLAATVLFIFSLYWMNAPKTARRAVQAGVAGMTLAVLATWFQPQIVHHGLIVVALIAGVAVGIPLSKVSLTAVPQRTALSHGFGGRARRNGQVLPVGQRRSGRTDAFSRGRTRHRGDSGIFDADGQPHGVRQTAGGA